MRFKTSLILACTACLLAAFPATAQSSYQKALALYNAGEYNGAMELFQKQSSDPLCNAYAVLCAIKLKTADYEQRIENYDAQAPSTMLYADIHYAYASNLFDRGDYALALDELNELNIKKIDKSLRSEYLFRKAYCNFAIGDHEKAADYFMQVLSQPAGEYTAPSQYTMGFMSYTGKDFRGAIDWFILSSKDVRFHDLSEFYIVDSKFMLKDYDYVITYGVELYDSVPVERKPHLSRILSESYLVKGNARKAMDYFRLDQSKKTNMTRSDYFYAGSVLYASRDYRGAVENFDRMAAWSDSLGQIARYQMGYSYIQLKDKLSALSSFKEASQLDFDADIAEDALFNYAKLSFDLNDDPSVFEAYLKRYSTTRKGDSIYSYMALAALHNHDYASAVAAYDNIEVLADEEKSNYVKAYYMRANQLISSGSYMSAIPCLKTSAYYLSRKDALGQLSRYWQAECLYKSEKFDESATIYTDLYNISALDSRDEGKLLPYNIAYCYLGMNNIPDAARWLDKYIGSGSRLCREDALVRRADCEYVRKSYQAAVSAYQRVLDEYHSPDKIYPYYRQALSYGLMGQKAKKVEVLSAVKYASKDAPLYSEATYELGRSYMDIGKNDEAISTFKALRNLTSDNTYAARALIGLGMAYRNNSDYEQALGSYKQVVSMMPGSEYAQDALAAIESIYQTTKEPEKYLAYVEENSIDTGKDKESMYFNTAEQVFLAGNYEQAVNSLETYLENYPSGAKRAEAYFYLAESCKQTGRTEKACQMYSRSLELSRDGSFAELSMLNYASLSYKLEHFEDAYTGYSTLYRSALMDENKVAAEAGMMNSAFKAKLYDRAIESVDILKADDRNKGEILIEADYIKAKSLMATSRRDEAMELFKVLAKKPSTTRGAESCYVLIQDSFDRGRFDEAEQKVYSFASEAGNQSYWLAKAFIVLGDIFVEKDNLSQAKATYESIRDGYVPSGASDDVQDQVSIRLKHIQSITEE